jgi:peptidoglycan/xylan/chitin deacetylase (PgdA/CDA1 family)
MHPISRRQLIKTALVGGVGLSLQSCMTADQNPPRSHIRYIAAYDTESAACLSACRKIVEVHKRMEMPATFFVLGSVLDANPAEFRKVLDDPLFEIASHTYSHRMLRNNVFCGAAPSIDERRIEIVKSKETIERVFERPCLGLRPGCGFDNALRGEPEVLKIIQQAGYRYVSSLLWGPDYSLPALLEDPFEYSTDGFPGLWELPGHGWHENLLKNNNQWGPKRLTLWPSPFPEAIPDGFCKTPQDEFRVNKVFLDKAAQTGKVFVSLIWHPWSLDKFDPEMKMLELTFKRVQELGLVPSTYAQLRDSLPLKLV